MSRLADATDPRFIGAQLAHLARFEAAVAPPEVTEAARVEEVARAIYNEGAYCGDCPYDGWDDCPECRRIVRGYARAAYRAAQDGGAEEAVRRVEALAEELEVTASRYEYAAAGSHDAGARNAHRIIAQRIRAALAPQAGAGQ